MADRKTQIISEKSQNITNFNKSLIQLMKKLEKHYPESGEIITLNNRMRLVKNELGREKLIEICGDAIYIYKDKILIRDEEFFLDFNNITKVSNLDRKGKNYELMNNIFTMTLKGYPNLDKKEQDEIYSKLRIMLTNYMEYKGYS